MTIPMAFAFLGFAGLIALMLAVPLGLFLLIRHREGERARSLAPVARRLGLGFEARGSGLPTELAGTFPFDQGFSGSVYNRMSGRLADTEVLFCDYAALVRVGGVIDRSSRFAPHQVAAFRLQADQAVDLEAVRREARAAVFRTEHANGWLVVSREGFVALAALPGFLVDAARVLALAAPRQGQAVGLALEPAHPRAS